MVPTHALENADERRRPRPPEQLLAAAERLPAEQLAAFAAEVLALRARRLAAVLPADEAALLGRIAAPPPAAEEQRYAELVAVRDAEALTPAAHVELLRLSDAREARNDDRLADLLRDLGAAAATDAG
jgi:hypothetical protein